MKIKVRLFATLREGRDKEIDLDVAEASSVRDIIEQLGIDEEDVTILLLNGRDAGFDTQLSELDVVSMFPPVGGG